MRIDLTSIMFNMTLQQGTGTPSWGTALGQREGHKYIYDGCEDIIVGMLYKKVPNQDVFCPLGKGGNKQSDYEYVLSSVFDKIYVNGIYVAGAKFILAIVKQLTAEATQHIGRKILKYSSKMTYQSGALNEDCFDKIYAKLGLSGDAAWFITDINVVNQDELHFTAKIANPSGSKQFLDSADRKRYCEQVAGAVKTKGGYNKIFYGAPGCGKSYYIQNIVLKDVPNKNVIRTTFYPDYANCDFIGQILPVVKRVADPNDSTKTISQVSYRFNPGPLTLALKRADETNDMVYLVVEEINRGNASAIFGDMFQLLDRVKDKDNEKYSQSEYPITNVNMQKYLGLSDTSSIIIPSNLTILATMNSSDQNVFTLDTAFKRRWQFEQISNDIKKDTKHTYKKWFVPGTNINWETFVSKINDKILEYKIANATAEDKRLGKYFVSKDCLVENAVDGVTSCKEEANNFAYKVLEYLWNDVCKYGQDDWFDTSKNRTLEELIDDFMTNGLAIFVNIQFGE